MNGKKIDGHTWQGTIAGYDHQGWLDQEAFAGLRDSTFDVLLSLPR